MISAAPAAPAHPQPKAYPMKLLRILAAGALALVFLAAGPALAQTAAPPAPSTTIDLAPLISTVILPAVGTLVLGVVAWAAKRFIGIQLDDKATATVNDVLQKGLAFATAKVGTLPLKIDVGSPIIATAANYALEHGPDALKRLGVSPDQLAQKLVARYMDPTVPVGVTELPAEPKPAPPPGA
jgi:hypothetical protein